MQLLVSLGALVLTLAGMGWWTRTRDARVARALTDRQYARLRALLGNPAVPFEDVVLPGTPEVRLEERIGGGWSFVARWPATLPMAPRDPARRAWTPEEPLFATTCGTVTPAALRAAADRRAVFAVDALRVPWTDPAEEPAQVVDALRTLWHRVVSPSVDDLAEGARRNGALRAPNLRALADRDRDRARAVARTITPADGTWLFPSALELARDTDALTGWVRAVGEEPWVRVAAVRVLGGATEPEALLPLARTCRALPETATAFADSVAAHRTPARDAAVVGLVTRELSEWPEAAATRLARLALAAAPTDERVLLAVVRDGSEAAREALAALAAHGTVAVVPVLRGLVEAGVATRGEVEPVILAIQGRAAGTRGGLALATHEGGRLSEVGAGGELSEAAGGPEARADAPRGPPDTGS